MNAPIKIAQASTPGAADIHVVKLEKPASGQAITVKTGFDGKVKLDFSAIADERITIVRVGETAVIFFHDNKSTITLDPFFGSGNLPLANLEFDFGGNRIYTPEQVAAILPFSVYQGILPAAGEGGGDPQDSGANFNPTLVADLPPILLNELLPPEALPGIDFQADLSPGLLDLIPVQSGAVIGGFVEEEHMLRDGIPSSPTDLSDGNEDGTPDPEDADAPNDNTTTSISGNGGNGLSLQQLVLGGDQPITFTVNDLTGQNVQYTNGNDAQSQGELIFYHRIDAQTIIGFANEDGNTAFNGAQNAGTSGYGFGSDRIVFVLEVSTTGDWTFTIYDQIDHPLTDDPSTGATETAFEDILSINLTPALHATDGNGSGLNFTGNAFVPSVIDDTPILLCDKDIRSVNEDDIKTYGDGIPGNSLGTSPNDGPFDGSFTGSPFNNGKGPATIFGALTDVVKVGADEHPDTIAENPKDSNYSGLVFSFLDPNSAAGQAALDALDGLGLSSKGVDLAFSFDIDGNLVAMANQRQVMKLTLNENGNYKFELFDQLDHDKPYDQFGDFPALPGDTLFPPADQNHDLQDGLPGFFDDVVFIDFGAIIQASDFDGDSVVLEDKLLIKVTDDIPEVRACEPICLTANEDDIDTNKSQGTSPNDGNWDGSYTGNPNNENNGPAHVFGSLAGPDGVVVSGADEKLTFSFIHNAEEKLFDLGLTSKGDTLRYDVDPDGDGYILYGYAPEGGGPGYQQGTDRLVFTFTLDENGDFHFRLHDQFDHDAPDYGNADQNFDLEVPGDDIWAIDFGRLINATDYDGDKVNLNDKLFIKIKDDVPEVKCGAPILLKVDEDDIDTNKSQGTSPEDGNGDGSYTGNPNDEDGGPAHVFGQLQGPNGVVVPGADEDLTFSFIGSAVNRLLDLGLQSKGEPVSYDVENGVITAFVNANGQVGYDYNPGDGDRRVFTFTLQNDGEFHFRLFDQLDHDAPGDDWYDGSPQADENFDLEDNEPGDVWFIDFGRLINATDYDGDKVNLDDTLLIKIRDDVPEITCAPSKVSVHENDLDNADPDAGNLFGIFDIIEGSAGTSPDSDTDTTDYSGIPFIGGILNTLLNGSTFANGALAGTVNFGTDEPGKFFLKSDAVDNLEAQNLKSKGDPLAYTSIAVDIGGFEGSLVIGYVSNIPDDLIDGVLAALGALINGDPIPPVDLSGFPGNPEFRLVFALGTEHSEDGNYQFRLFDQLDHAPANIPNTGYNEDDQLFIDFSELFGAQDFDGDSIDLPAGTFTVEVKDDEPELNGEKNDEIVDEDDIDTEDSLGSSPDDGNGDGSFTGSPFSNTGGPATVFGSLQDLFFFNGVVEPGADEPLTFSFIDSAEGITDFLGGLAGLKSQGETIKYDIQGNTLYAYVGSGDYQPATADRLVFQFTLQENGFYSFELHDQIDHDPPNDGDGALFDFDDGDSDGPGAEENFDLQDNSFFFDITELPLGYLINATDYDGDTVNIGDKLTIKIRDDVPEAVTEAFAAVQVDEDELSTAPGTLLTPDLTDGITDGDGDTDEATFSGASLAALFNGADEPLSFSLNGSVSGNVQTIGGTNVTSQSEQVIFGQHGGDIVGYVEVSGAGFDPLTDREVFRLIDNGDGTFTFDLKDKIDHLPLATGGGDNETLTIDLTPAFGAVDFDGDTATLAADSIHVVIENDIPVALSNTTNYIANGDFQDGTWSAPAWWGSSAQPGNVPGWTIAGDPSDTPSPGSPLFEKQADGFLGLSSSTDNGMLDMGASGGNYRLTQTVGAGAAPDLSAGQKYVIQFEVAAPFPGTALLQVLWNGTVIGTIDTSKSAGEMDKYAFIVEATSPSSDQLQLREIGTGNVDLGNEPGNPQNDLQTERWHGTYVANFEMFALDAVVDEDGLTIPPDFSQGNNDSQTGDAVVADGDGDAKEATANGTLNITWGADNFNGGADGFALATGYAQDGTGRKVTFTNNIVTIAGGTLTSHGDAITVQLQNGDTKLVGIADLGGANERIVFEVTLSDDGSGAFRFILKDQLDHAPGADENDIALTFNYTATDSDGDTATGSFVVGIDDDVPLAFNDKDTVAESEPDQVNQTSGNVITGVDPDAPPADNLLNADSVGADEPPSLCKVVHNGETYTLDDAVNGLLTIDTALGGTLEIQLTGPNAGQYTYTAPVGVPHPPATSFTVSVGNTTGVTITAFDPTLPNPSDAADVLHVAGKGFGVASPGSNGTGVDDGDGEPRFDEINHGPGDGQSETLVFKLDGTATSANVDLSWFFAPQEQNVGSERGQWQAYSNGVLVGSGEFTASSATGEHSFTIDMGSCSFDELRFSALLGTADASGQGDSSDYYVQQIEFINEPPALETFDYTLKDFDQDGDTATLTIKVTDGGPTVVVEPGEGDLALQLDETHASPVGVDTYAPGETESLGGAPNGDLDDVGAGPDGTTPFGEVESAPGVLAGLFSVNVDPGPDPITTTHLFNLFLQDAGGNPVAGGVQTNLSVTDPDGNYADPDIYLFNDGGGVITGRVGNNANGDIAFRVTLDNPSDPATAKLTVEQILPIDHAAYLVSQGWAQNPDNGHFYKFVGGNYTWDAADAAAQAMGGHLATATSAGENNFIAGIFNGNQAQFGAWLGGSDAGAEGNFVWVRGPETGQPFAFTNWEGDVGFGAEPNDALHAGDDDYVTIGRFWNQFTNDPTTWNDDGSTGANGHGFIVEISEDQFDEQAFLAALGGGQSGIAVELTVTVEDSNGSTSSDSETVNVTDSISFDDDGPVLLGVAQGDAVNGLFLDGFTENGNAWGTGSGTAAGTAGGWTIFDNGPAGGTVELQRVGNGYRGMSSSTDGFMVDLAATPGNIGISQTLSVADGEIYTLTFEAGSSVGSGDQLEVWFGGTLIDSITPTGPGELTTYTFNLVGGSGLTGNNLLEFREVGAAEDNHGTYLANVKVTRILDDEDTLNPNAPGNQGDPSVGDDGSGVVATGKILFDAGTDGLKSIAFSDDDLAFDYQAIWVDATGVGTAHDIELEWKAGEDSLGNPTGYEKGGTLFGTMLTPDGEKPVFTLEVDSDGNYEFTLIAPLDHPWTDSDSNNDGNPETSWEDNLLLNLDFAITDGDDDTVAGTMQFNVDDDTPVVTGIAYDGTVFIGPELILNGSFEDGHGLTGNQWNIYQSLTGGWTSGPDNIPFELQRNGVGGLASQQGFVHAELDGDTVGNPGLTPQGTPDPVDTNASVQQVVAGTVAGQTYELSFWYAPRPGQGANSSGLKVFFEGQEVHNIDPTPNPSAGWHTVTIQVTATGPNALLAFQGTGPQDEFGAFLDNVSLRAVAGTLDDEDTNANGIGVDGGPGDDGSGFVRSGKIDFSAGADGLKAIAFADDFELDAIYVDANGVGTSHEVDIVWNAGQDANGANPGNAYTNGGTLVGTMAIDGVGIVPVFTLEVDSQGNYVFTLQSPLDHPEQDDGDDNNGEETSWEDNLLLDLDFTITDGDNDAAQGTLLFDVDDDSPEATDDGLLGAASEGTSGIVIGTLDDLLGDDAYGADGEHATTPIVIGGGSLGGTVTIDGNNLVYTPPADVGPEGDVETFEYTIMDGDGDTDAATFSVQVNNAGVGNLAASANLLADDDDVAGAGGNPGTPAVGDDDPTLSGIITFALGDDALQSIVLSTSANTTPLQTLDGDAVDTFWDAANDTLVGYVQGTDPEQSANRVFIIELANIDNDSADYTLTLLKPVKHAGTNPGFEDNSTPFNVTVTLTDVGGNSAATAFSVIIDDDTPVSFAPNAVELTNAPTASDFGYLDSDADIDNNVGADKPGTITFANLVDGQASGLTSGDQPILLFLLNNDGNPNNDGTNPPTLEGRIGGPAGTLVFTIVLNHNLAGDDTYAVTMHGAIDNFALAEFTGSASVPAGNAAVRLFETFGSIDLDVLFSSSDGTINSSGSGVGIGNQSIDAPQTLDIDFLKNGAYADNTVNGPADYQVVNSLTLAVTQNNNTGNDADMLIRAFDANGNEVQITDIVVNSATLVGNAAAPDGDNDNIDDDGVPSNKGGTVTALANGLGFELHDVGGGTAGQSSDDDNITIIAAGGYSRIEITNIGSDSGGQDTFDLNFKSVSAQSAGPIELPVDVALTDADGDSVESTLDITLQPTMAAAPPVIDTGASVLSAFVKESGDLPLIDEAGTGVGLDGKGNLEPIVPISPAMSAALDSLQSDPGGLPAVLDTIQGLVGGDRATAIATVWDYLDDLYPSVPAGQDRWVDEAFVRLGVEYAQYVKDGGMPLIDVTAQFKLDDVDPPHDADTTYDRVQSLHDNLLGNLNGGVLGGRFTAKEAELIGLVQSVDPDLLSRDWYSGNDQHSAIHDDVKDWDVDNGFVTHTTGKIVATDVNGGPLTFTVGSDPISVIDGTTSVQGIYGTFTIHSVTGEWKYVLDNYDGDTQALNDGAVAAEPIDFLVTVKDPQGNDTQQSVSIDVNGTDDIEVPTAPVVLYATADDAANGQNGVEFSTIQAAETAALDGQFIVVAAGVYAENVAIDKAVTILGANAGKDGNDPARGTEAQIIGKWTINAPGGEVVIDGFRFINDATTTGNARLITVGSDAEIVNNIFHSTVAGGPNATADQAIHVNPVAGIAVFIGDNLITGDHTGKFNTASWNRAIYWEGGADIEITDNVIEYARTALSLTGPINLMEVNGNTIAHSGTGISAWELSGLVSNIVNNVFSNVDTEINDRGNSTGVTFDIGGTGNTSDNYFGFLGGIGNDAILGTSGRDAILANQGNDGVVGMGGDDSIFVNADDNNDADIVDGGLEGLAGKDTLVVSNANVGGIGNTLDPGDFGNPAATASGAPSATPMTFVMTSVGDTWDPSVWGGVNSINDIQVTMGQTGVGTPMGSVLADEIEDVQFNLGSGGDTVIVQGDFTGSALAPNTITVNGGAGNDAVGGLLTSAHDIVFRGNGGDDIFIAGPGDDTFEGGAGGDTLILSGDAADYTITFDPGTGKVVVTDADGAINGDDGTVAIDQVENIDYTTGTDAVLGPVMLFDSSNQLMATFQTLKEAADAANGDLGDDFTIYVNGTVDVGASQVFIDKSVTIVGAGAGISILQASANTGGGSGDAAGMILVDAGHTFNMSKLTLSGAGYNINRAVITKSDGAIDSMHFDSIRYSKYVGIAVSVQATADFDVTDSLFTNIGRIGVHYGTGSAGTETTTGTVQGITYIGKGEVDGLDYGVEAGRGAVIEVHDSFFTNIKGVATSDGSTSAGILVTDFFGLGTEATIGGNTVTDSTFGVAVGYATNDGSAVTFLAGNDFTGATEAGVIVVGDVTITGADLVNGTFDWQAGTGFEGVPTAGSNSPTGGDFDDLLAGGLGNDTLTGNGGADNFLFSESGLANIDEVTDYTFGEGDRLDLSALLDGVFDAGDGDVLSDFLQINENPDGSGNAVVLVDLDGGGNDFGDPGAQVATLTGISAGDMVRVYLDNAEHDIQTLA